MKWITRIALILFYCVPYMFLSMNGDVTAGTMWFYALMVAAFCLLCGLAKKTNNIGIVVIGNICSLIVSFVFLSVFRTEKWDWYFKPFTDLGLLATGSAIMFVIQLIIVFRRKNRFGNDGEV